MINKNLLSGKDRELVELAEQYEQAKAENKPLYMDAEDLADLADWYAVRQKREMALEVIRYGLRLHPDNSSLLIEKAYIYLDDYRLEEAQTIADKIDSELNDAKILQAQIYLLSDKDNEARQLLDTIEDKDDIDTLINVAYMYVNAHQPHEAYQWLLEGIGLYDDDEPFMTVLGDTYYGMGELDEAMKIYNDLIDRNPYSSPYWFGLARCYFDQQQYDKAIEACDYATLADEEFPDAYMMKGHAFFYLQNDEKALENFRIAARLGAVNQCFIDTFIGLTHAAKEEWPQAYEHLQQAIDAYNDETVISLSTLYANAAMCLHKMGQQEKSDQYWAAAHDACPDDAEVYIMEGKMYMEEGNYAECQRCWERALHFAPTANTWNEIGNTCLEYGKPHKALSAFEHVKRLDPDFSSINEKLAIVYLMLDDTENFQTYNRQCEHPITASDLQLILDILKKNDKDDLFKTMKDILNNL